MRHARTLYVTDPTTGRRWPIPAGGSTDTIPADTDDQPDGDAADADADGDTDSDGEDGDEPDPDGADQLGDPGKRALRAMKQQIRDLKRELRQARTANDKPADQPGDDDLDPEQLRQQIRQELEGELRTATARDRVLDKVEAKAARRFQNPALVRRLLKDETDDLLDDQGNPDVEAITERLNELLEDEPYLAVTSATPSGSGDAGSRQPPKDRDPADLTDPDEVIKWGTSNRRRRF
jgi:hypothetical protein